MAISYKNVLTLRATHVLILGFFYEKQVDTGVMDGSATVMASMKKLREHQSCSYVETHGTNFFENTN